MLNPLQDASLGFRERSRRVPRWIREGLAYATLAVAGYQAWTWSGLYRWFCEGQISLLDGQYYAVLSFFLSWFAMFVPLALAIYPWAIARYGALSPEEVQREREREQVMLARFSRLDVRGLLIGVVFLSGAGLFGIRLYALRGLEEVSVAQLAAGQNTSAWVSVPLEQADYDSSVVEQGSISHWIVPLRDPASPDAPAAVFIQFTTSGPELEPPESGEGIVALRPLDYQARTVLEETGVPVAEETVVVDLQEDPGELWDITRVFGGLGAGLTVVCGLLVWRRGW